MRWSPKGINVPKLAAEKPAGDEPAETVISDQTKPVTSAYRTAQDMIKAAAAKRNQENNMSNQKKRVAADPADASAKADKRVDTEGVGGVIDPSNEQASKPDTNTNVEGKGGVHQDSNTEATKPDETQNTDDVGNKQTSGPTKTFDNSNQPGSAVTDKVFKGGQHKQAWGDESGFPGDIDQGKQSPGAQPADPVGKADKRVDVTEKVQVNNPQKGTDQWTGTDGNGVTKQQDPVTRKVDPNIEQRSSGLVSLAALKLAEAEVELGLLDKDQKFARLAELEDVDETQIEAEHRALAKVKKAGLSRTASKGGTGRVPSFKRIASEEPAPAQPVNDAVLDSSLFN